jgi:Outer membrane efflux protein
MIGPSAVSAIVLVAAVSMPVPISAQAPPPLDLASLGQGPAALPLIWAPYRPMPLPPVDLRNGSLLEQRIGEGPMRLSLHDFLQLVVENDLDLQAARYDVAIAQVDLLRAQSGQAARGTALAPLPDALFAGAIGAGVSSTAGLSSGGTGGAAITTQGKLVAFGPRGNFDPTLSLNLSYDHLVNPLNTARVAGLDAVTVPTTVLLTRFQQQLPYGTSYSISVNLQRQASTQQGLLFNPALTSFVALQVYQPLLNGFGLALTQRFVTLADNNRKIVREAFHALLDARLSAAANAYWDLVASRAYLRVAEQAVAAAQQQDDEDRQRVRVGVMAPIDVLSADAQLASDISTQVQSATVGVTRDRAQVQAAQRAVSVSRQVFEAEQKKLGYLISTPYRVTLAQRDLIAAQVADIQARVDYARALVAHQMAVGDFLERHGIVADDARRGRLLRE